MGNAANITEAVILAGGLGTRLKSEIGEFPKPLAPVNGQPFLQILFNYLHRNGIKRIILAVGYKWELIQKEFGSTYKGIELIYSVESKILGTGGALKLALQKAESESVFVLNGDTIFTIDLSEFAQHHIKTNAMCSLALTVIDDNTRYGTVLLDENSIIKGFTEKGETSGGFINAGIYLLRKNALKDFESDKTFSFETDYLAKNWSKVTIDGVVFEGYFKDIGIPADYRQFEKDLHTKQLKDFV